MPRGFAWISVVSLMGVMFAAATQEGAAALSATSQSFQAWAAGLKIPERDATAAQGNTLWFVPDVDAAAAPGEWISESVWRGVAAQEFVFLDGSGDARQAATAAKVLTRGGALYFWFDCADGDAQHLVYASIGEDSQDLWRDDCIEIFLRSRVDGAEKGPEPFHLIANPAGAVSVFGVSEKARPTIRTRARILQSGWRVELCVPLRALQAEGELPLAWSGNFSRSRKGRDGANAEETAWRSTGELRTFVPDKLGTLYFEAVEKKLALPALETFIPAGQDLLKLAGSSAAALDILSGKYQAPAALVPLLQDASLSGDRAATLALLPLYDRAAGATQAAVAQVHRDKDALHIHVACSERDMSSIKAAEPKDAKNIWDDDSVEIFLAPGRREGSDYRQIIVNAAGAAQINKGKKPEPLPGTETHVSKSKDGWTVDVVVPFAAFAFVDGRIPALWGMNIVRNRPGRNGAVEETSVWSRPGAWTLHDPARFGSVWLESATLLPELGEREELNHWSAEGSAWRLATTPKALPPEAVFNWDLVSEKERTELKLTDMVNEHQRRYVREAFAQRDKQWEAVKDWDAWEVVKKQVRANFWKSIGAAPEKKFPLNPRVSLVFEDDEIRCERVLYESRPRFFVSANLFLPLSQKGQKAPTIVFLTGHSTRGRFSSLAQSEELARSGYAVLALDLLGQGERIDVNNGFGSRTPTSNHYEEGAGCVLTGTNLAGYMVYDVMRGLDFLETRSEVDMARVALTGASGGGTLTGYVAALDDRVAASAPVSALGNSRGGGGNYDAEQVLFGSYPWALDAEGFLSLMAPRPAIVICEVSGDEARQQNLASYEIARRIYNLKGAGAKLEYVPTSGPHGYGPSHFNPFKSWLARTLPPNPETPPYSKKKSKVPQDTFFASKAGNVFYSRELAGAETVHSLNTRAIALPLSYSNGVADAASATARSAEITQRLRELLALEPGPVAAPKATLRGSENFGGFAVEKWMLETEPGVLVPAVWVKSGRAGKSPAVIWLDQRGKRSALSTRWPVLRGLLESGVSVLLPDLRATGETRVDDDETFLGGESELNGYSFRVAHPLIGMRVRDALSCATWLRGREDVDAARVGIAGDSESGVNPTQIRQPRLATDAGLEALEQAQSLGPAVALLAFALDEKLSCCAVHGGLGSYAMICPQLYFMHPWGMFVPGILKVCDVADICAAAAPRPLLLAGSVNAWNQRLDKAEEAAAGFPRLFNAYYLAGAPAAVRVDQAGVAENVAAYLKGVLK